MKSLLAVLVCITVVSLAAPPVLNAGLNRKYYSWIISDCQTKPTTSGCSALKDYLENRAKGSCLKASVCTSHLKSKGVQGNLATDMCNHYFNDR